MFWHYQSELHNLKLLYLSWPVPATCRYITRPEKTRVQQIRLSTNDTFVYKQLFFEYFLKLIMNLFECSQEK